MTKERMTRTQMERYTICGDCRHFHRYRMRDEVSIRDGSLGEEEIEFYGDANTYCRCLIGRGLPPLELTDSIIVDCNQFERREEKRKL